MLAGVQMLGWISRINLHLLLNNHRSHQLGNMWIIQVMTTHMVICLWMMRICHRLPVSNQSRILMMIP